MVYKNKSSCGQRVVLSRFVTVLALIAFAFLSPSMALADDPSPYCACDRTGAAGIYIQEFRVVESATSHVVYDRTSGDSVSSPHPGYDLVNTLVEGTPVGPITLKQDVEYNFSIIVNHPASTGLTGYFSLYIDDDAAGDTFVPVMRIQKALRSTPPTSFSLTEVAIAYAVTPGTRIRVTFNTAGFTPDDGCGSLDRGETEDYQPVKIDPPDVVELSSFTASGSSNGVLLAWETRSELENAGFNVWRSNKEKGHYVRLTRNLIPAEGGPSVGASYTYEDTKTKPGRKYFYKLEDVDLNGKSTFHGPVTTRAGAR